MRRAVRSAPARCIGASLRHCDLHNLVLAVQAVGTLDVGDRPRGDVYVCSLCGILFAALGLTERDELPERRLCPECLRLPMPPKRLVCLPPSLLMMTGRKIPSRWRG